MRGDPQTINDRVAMERNRGFEWDNLDGPSHDDLVECGAILVCTDCGDDIKDIATWINDRAYCTECASAELATATPETTIRYQSACTWCHDFDHPGPAGYH